MPQPSNSRPPHALFGYCVCLAFVVALGGCSTSSRLAMSDRPVPSPRPALRNPPSPAPDHKSALGRPSTPASDQYAWNGSPNRVSEGAPPPHSPPLQHANAAHAPLPQHASPHAQAQAPLTSAAAHSPVHIPRGSVLVQPGDTLYGLSRRHGVSISALMDTNKLRSLSLQPGQVLKLPTASRPRG